MVPKDQRSFSLVESYGLKEREWENTLNSFLFLVLQLDARVASGIMGDGIWFERYVPESGERCWKNLKDILRDQIKCDGGGGDSSSEVVTDIFWKKSV